MKRVRVPFLPIGPDAALDPVASHHLAHVMRAKIGTQVQLYDGAGQEQLAILTAIDPQVRVKEASPVVVRKEGPSVHLILSVLKHQAMDLALRMATEAGASVIHPVIMERTIARGDRHDRWERILTSSTSQCGRAVVPTLLPVQTLSTCLNSLEIPLLFGAPGAHPARPASSECGLIVGPAGGLASAEANALLRRGALAVGLGPHILRAETACAVGLGLLRAT